MSTAGGVTLARAGLPAAREGFARRLSDLLSGRTGLLALILLTPPLLWLGVIYFGSLTALLMQSFYSIDEYSGAIVREPTLKTYGELLRPANLDVILRTTAMAAAVTLACAALALPVAYTAARYATGAAKAAFYLAVMMPLWSSYLVKVYAWKLILAKEGALAWAAQAGGVSATIDTLLALPIIGGPSLSVSYLGQFLVFVYLWLPYMILPVQAALERVPTSLVEASADLGARPRQTFSLITLPLALPGLAAGSIFTFSLTFGDYILPQIIGPSTLNLGQVVYTLQGTAGNIPLAAAFSVVPIVVMGFYLWAAKRLGAFDAL
jgi:putative spermidine/putrescine transport system permease protein